MDRSKVFNLPQYPHSLLSSVLGRPMISNLRLLWPEIACHALTGSGEGSRAPTRQMLEAGRVELTYWTGKRIRRGSGSAKMHQKSRNMEILIDAQQ